MDNFEQLPNPEQDHASGETQSEILYAIHDINPEGEEFWYTKDPTTGEKIPLDTKLDEDGVTRELLPDNTLGREVVQDPTDDPERVRSLYGPSETPDDDKTAIAAEATLPLDKRTAPNPLALSPETPEDSNPAHTLIANQGRANALSSQTNSIQAKILETSPLNDSPEDPSKFAENVAEYRDQLQNSLDSITATLMQKADTLQGLGMPDAAHLFATKTEKLHSAIRDEIQAAGEDYSRLVKIYAQYFDGDSASVISQIEPALTLNPSTIKFNALLSHVNTIPELSYLADKLVESRNNLKK